MTQAPLPSTSTPAIDARARRRRAFGRFLVAHMFAYVPAFAWAVAWTPIAIIRNFDHLQRVASDEKVVSDFVLRQMVVPVIVVAAVPHLVAIPWIRKPEKRWLVLYGTATALLTVAGLGVAIVYWLRLLAGR